MDEASTNGRPEAPSPSDEALMASFRHGDARAFEVLVSRHRRGLFNFLLRSVGNQSRAEELLQDVFVRVIRAKGRYEQTARFSTWIYTIARNICVDESRRAKFRRTVSLDSPRRGRDGEEGASMLETTAEVQVGVDDAAMGPTLQSRLAAAIDRLPEDQREVFFMRQLSGLSFKEIGEVVGAPENTVKSRMRYALEKLREELVDLHDPGE
ncbi:MAG: RNA polymerase sigma factor [Nannocystis sp.]|nr:RNA polymerase sigma factor [Nannocystis sp.]